jgi:hypothetical protein
MIGMFPWPMLRRLLVTHGVARLATWRREIQSGAGETGPERASYCIRPELQALLRCCSSPPGPTSLEEAVAEAIAA